MDKKTVGLVLVGVVVGVVLAKHGDRVPVVGKVVSKLP